MIFKKKIKTQNKNENTENINDLNYKTFFNNNENLIKLNLEKSIFEFDINLFSEKSADLNYLFLPFEILLVLISPSQPNNLLYNFDRINILKNYDLINIKNEDLTKIIKYYQNKPSTTQKSEENLNFPKVPEINNMNKYITKPNIMGYNPKSACFPFYLLFLGEEIKTKFSKSKILEEIICDKSDFLKEFKEKNITFLKTDSYLKDKSNLIVDPIEKTLCKNSSIKNEINPFSQNINNNNLINIHESHLLDDKNTHKIMHY